MGYLSQEIRLNNDISGMDYLLTWNCKHIANARMIPQIEKIAEENGYEHPVICTPQELLEDYR